MKKIPLASGKGFAIVDDCDYDYLSQFKWHFVPTGGHARRSVYDKKIKKVKNVMMHRDIMNFPEGLSVDHINHNGLDNRRENLRVCTHRQNMMNKKIINNCKSKYKGVTLKVDKWRARISTENGRLHLGYFLCEKEAAIAYNNAAIKHFGEFAHLNEV